MMDLEHNVVPGQSRAVTMIRRVANNIRTWYKFHIKYPWVKYHGFVRVMHGVSFAKGIDVVIGNNVQFGPNCEITTSTHFGSNILIAGKVSIVGRKNHTYDNPGKTIWESPRGNDDLTIIEDDIWIGAGSIIMSGVCIGRGSIVAAGSVVTNSIPSCEIWGGNPAHKIKNRFLTDEEKMIHLDYLQDLCQ